MNSLSYHRDTCRLCEGRELQLVIHLEPTPIADAFLPVKKHQEVIPLDVFFCRNCGHAQLLDVVYPEILFRDYIYVTSSSLGLVGYFRELAEDLLERANPQQGSLVIDVGSNDGSALRFFKERGMRVLGIDPAREIATKATESGIETVPEFLTPELARKINAEHGPASIVTANNVFAHADDLAQMAESVRLLLARDGLFEFESNYMVGMVQQMLFDNIYHEHLSYHTVKPLAAFLGRHGMQMIDSIHVSSKGGSLRGIAQFAGGPRSTSASVAKMTAIEKKLGFDRAETFTAFANRINEIKRQVVGLLSDLKAKGKTMAGYGASPSVTTLLYHMGLDRFLDFLADDNPRKYNTFSPGHHIPVFASGEIYERNPDYVVILAWRFADPIIKKHQAFLDRGGKFIVPLPKLEIRSQD